MKPAFAFTCVLILLSTQACTPVINTVSPPPTRSSIVPTATKTIIKTMPEPIAEATLAEGVVITSGASTAIVLPALPTLTPPSDLTGTIPPGRNPVPIGGISLQDGGRIFNMRVGDSFLLNLGSDAYEWTVTVDNEKVLRRELNVTVIKGAQGIYQALAPGTATLSANGDPLCLKSRPACAIPSILFFVTVVVE